MREEGQHVAVANLKNMYCKTFIKKHWIASDDFTDSKDDKNKADG